ncbi:gpi-anchor transamidase [Diplogelasinospora grovesii]|uniref:Gpi-anchor transamidase n=1 Tax=Diplogelasinospora grovesii TaxID=303347 RepID=A0AAN6N6W9_9PEZI|nr:gpi-anchor transamidase [Diplogelasinospora grovesii]
MKLSTILRLPALLAAALLLPATIVEAEHTSNWAVLVSTSRFWFNYRHLANVLSMYRTVKRLGIPDSQIILMLPDDMACNPRNAFPGTVYSNADRAVDLYGDNIEVDYRGYEVTVENFIRLLTDRVGDEMPRSKRLLTDDRSNILVYMTGHGGNEFLKFQDAEEIGAFDLADAFEQMWEKKRYHEILFMIDTCQANTMFSKLYSPNIIATGSSELDQSSYSHHADNDVGVAVIDRYTYYNLEFLESEVRDTSSKKTIGDLFDSYTYEKIHSNAGVRYDLFRGGAEAARSRLVTDFFGNVQNVEVDGSKDTTLEEELLSLSKTIAALRQKADEEDAAGKNTTTAAKSFNGSEKKIQFAKPLTDENWWTKKIYGATALAGCALLWGLGSRPLIKRAIAFSCDGELAVTADDSIHIFVPEFPDLVRSAERRQALKKAKAVAAAANKTNGDHSTSTPGGSSAYPNPDDDDDDSESSSGGEAENGYDESSRHIPVSYPPLDPRVNRELFQEAGEPFPYDDAPDTNDVEDDESDEVEDDDDGDGPEGGDDDDDDEDDSPEEEGGTRPYGAGYGPITGVGSSMNHVVAISWSPSGLGINRRPILSVLTGAGVLAMYGDGSAGDSILPRANDGMLQRRTLDSWQVLWGVGERLMVPKQQPDASEYIRGFAWAGEYAPGQALLAYINDEREVHILSVQSYYPDEARYNMFDGATPKKLTWSVQEVAKFKAEGPHPTGDEMDPEWMPTGTSWGLSWSPWLHATEGRVAVLSYIDTNFVGFRKITILEPWERCKTPCVVVNETNNWGTCLHLSTDAFVKFEDAIWIKEDDAKYVRGIIVTGFKAVSFLDVPLQHSAHQDEPHTMDECGTTYPDENAPHNPIIDLVIHPPNFTHPAPTPLYTCIRMSATNSNPDWWESNLPTFTGEPFGPQWANDITEKLDVGIPADIYQRFGGMNDDDEDDEGDEDVEDDADDDVNDMDDDDDDDDYYGSGNEEDGGRENENEHSNKVEVLTESKTNDIHPHRFRLHGLASSPGGGGVTAVLASVHNTQHPDRGGWHTMRSVVYFGHKTRHLSRHHLRIQNQPHSQTGQQQQQQVGMSGVSTEGALFEWMYGNGPEVPGATTTHPNTLFSVGLGGMMNDMFMVLQGVQKCNLCGSTITTQAQEGGGGGMMKSVCAKGHRFGTCATSRLAIQIPGITRCCGTCGSRTLRAEYIADKAAAQMYAHEFKEHVERCKTMIQEGEPDNWWEQETEEGLEDGLRGMIIKELGDGFCGRCGGKFLN